MLHGEQGITVLDAHAKPAAHFGADRFMQLTDERTHLRSPAGEVIARSKQSPASSAGLSLWLQVNSRECRQTKIGQQLMRVFLCILNCERTCAYASVQIRMKAVAVAADGDRRRRRGRQHFNRLKHDTRRHTARRRQRPAKQGCHRNYQWRVC